MTRRAARSLHESAKNSAFDSTGLMRDWAGFGNGSKPIATVRNGSLAVPAWMSWSLASSHQRIGTALAPGFDVTGIALLKQHPIFGRDTQVVPSKTSAQ